MLVKIAVHKFNTFTTQQQIFAEAKGIYRCICNGTSDKYPQYPGRYVQS